MMDIVFADCPVVSGPAFEESDLMQTRPPQRNLPRLYMFMACADEALADNSQGAQMVLASMQEESALPGDQDLMHIFVDVDRCSQSRKTHSSQQPAVEPKP